MEQIMGEDGLVSQHGYQPCNFVHRQLEILRFEQFIA
jgi:hypothetical protein